MPKRQLQNRQKSGVSHAETTLPERWRFARRNVIFRTCQKDGVSHAKTPPTFLERWRFACRKRIHVIAKNLMISLQAVENQRRQPSAFAKTEVLYCHGLCNCAVHTILQQSTIHYMYIVMYSTSQNRLSMFKSTVSQARCNSREKLCSSMLSYISVIQSSNHIAVNKNPV